VAPDLFRQLGVAAAEKLKSLDLAPGKIPVVVTQARRRRTTRLALAARGVPNAVLSYEEIGMDARPNVLGFIPV